jgi:hypothetical protein
MIEVLAASYFEFFTGDFLAFGLLAAIVFYFQRKKDDEFFGKK